MSGGLAIWYEPAEGVSPEQAADQRGRPSLELHINLWRDRFHKVDFIDLGLMVAATESIGRLFVFLPRALSENQLADLSPVLRHTTSLCAVFNEVLTVNRRREESFDVFLPSRPFCRVHTLGQSEDLSVELVDTGQGSVGTVIAVGRNVCARFCATDCGRHYVRFRIMLDQALPHIFSSDAVPQDFWVLSSFHRTEIIEFRLNEMRSLPMEIHDRCKDGLIEVSAIHYFLIRDARHELVLHHSEPRKIRTLEANIWRHYLRGRPPSSDGDAAMAIGNREDRLIIYHWKSEKKDHGEFHAFARFASSRLNPVFVAGVAIVGALGSALQALTAEILATQQA